MSRSKTLLLLSLLSGFVKENPQEQALQIVHNSPGFKEKDALQFIESISEIPTLQRKDSHISTKPACRGRIPDQNQARNKDEILVFVSFSMPDEALKGLFQEAKKYNARLIIRGLVADSFKNTQQKIQSLHINVDIDPNLFDEYKITHVPTFIKVHKDKGLHLKGNVALSYVYEQFEKTLPGATCS